MKADKHKVGLFLFQETPHERRGGTRSPERSAGMNGSRNEVQALCANYVCEHKTKRRMKCGEEVLFNLKNSLSVQVVSAPFGNAITESFSVSSFRERHPSQF